MNSNFKCNLRDALWVKQISNFVKELLFPSFCLGCKQEGTFLCEDCKATLEISEYNYCLCNKNPTRLQFDQNKNGKCYICKDKKLSGLYSALPYKEKVLTRKLIHNFKYEPYIKSLAKVLSKILIEHLVLAKNNTNQIWENSILIPVPLEKRKMKKRDYNQAEELAKELSKVINIPLVTNVLMKTKSTSSQMKLKKEEREKNVKDAFSIKNHEQIQDKKIFLVDDVYTTGSTMEECAKTLKDVGVKSVWGIVIAREE